MDAGSVLAGRYRLVSLIGRGGMGSVWKAEHLGLRAPVAVKLIDQSISMLPEALSRFHREAQAAASLRSPHVVQILDHGVDEASQVPFIVMELMEGESLAARLHRVKRLSAPETASVVSQVARALVRAHEAGVIHRD
ncbi:MAG: serine/threonine-protein kinase, partial [Polyangiaceae bacterium]